MRIVIRFALECSMHDRYTNRMRFHSFAKKKKQNSFKNVSVPILHTKRCRNIVLYVAFLVQNI